jgi:hypothetical protein
MVIENLSITDIYSLGKETFNITGLLNNVTMPPELLEPILKLIAVLKILSIVFIIYLIFLIIKGIGTYLRNKRIDITYEKVLEMDRKLDILLRSHKVKAETSENKQGVFNDLFGRKEVKKKKSK